MLIASGRRGCEPCRRREREAIYRNRYWTLNGRALSVSFAICSFIESGVTRQGSNGFFRICS